MRKIFPIVLILFTIHSHAQKKISLFFFAGGNYPFTQTTTTDFNTFSYHEISRTSNTITFEQYTLQYKLHSSYISKPGISVGSKASYRLNPFFSVSAGIGIKSFELKRKNTLGYKATVTGQVTVNYTPPPPGQVVYGGGSSGTGYESFANYYYYAEEEKIQFVTLNFPLHLAFKTKKSRFGMFAGVSPELIIKYKLTTAINKDPEGFPISSGTTEHKFNLPVDIGVSFSINKFLATNIFYQHYFNALTEGKVNPRVQPKVVGLSLVYNFF